LRNWLFVAVILNLAGLVALETAGSVLVLNAAALVGLVAALAWGKQLPPAREAVRFHVGAERQPEEKSPRRQLKSHLRGHVRSSPPGGSYGGLQGGSSDR